MDTRLAVLLRYRCDVRKYSLIKLSVILCVSCHNWTADCWLACSRLYTRENV